MLTQIYFEIFRLSYRTFCFCFFVFRFVLCEFIAIVHYHCIAINALIRSKYVSIYCYVHELFVNRSIETIFIRMIEQMHWMNESQWVSKFSRKIYTQLIEVRVPHCAFRILIRNIEHLSWRQTAAHKFPSNSDHLSVEIDSNVKRAMIGVRGPCAP